MTRSASSRFALSTASGSADRRRPRRRHSHATTCPPTVSAAIATAIRSATLGRSSGDSARYTTHTGTAHTTTAQIVTRIGDHGPRRFMTPS
nr:MAG: hypothetical protein DIU60_03165 [Actinomycetota bacterium]